MQVKGPHVSATIAAARQRVFRRAEGRARLTDGDSTAHTTLALLDAQIRQQDTEHVLWTNRLGDVAERVDSRSSDRLLVRLEQVKQLEADSHPLAGRDEFCSTIRDSADEVDGRLLDLLVSVAQNGRHSRHCLGQLRTCGMSDAQRSFTGGDIWVMPTTFAIAAMAAMILSARSA